MSDERQRTEPGSSSRKIDHALRAAKEAIARQYESWDMLGEMALPPPISEAHKIPSLVGKIDQVDRKVRVMRRDRWDRAMTALWAVQQKTPPMA